MFGTYLDIVGNIIAAPFVVVGDCVDAVHEMKETGDPVVPKFIKRPVDNSIDTITDIGGGIATDILSLVGYEPEPETLVLATADELQKLLDEARRNGDVTVLHLGLFK